MTGKGVVKKEVVYGPVVLVTSGYMVDFAEDMWLKK